jgi:branched-chain amino acid transport system substrate-binding protein
MSNLRPTMTRRRVLAAGAALTVLPAPFVRADETPIRIGFPVPLTGPYGAAAQDQVRAAQLAIAQFNGGGGLNGRTAELLVRDDKLNPGEAATRALELIEKDKADFIAGSLSASVQLAINNVAKERKVLFNSISQSDAIAAMPDWSKYTFHEALTPHMTAGAVGRYAFGKYGKRVAFLIADYAFGTEMLAGFKAAGAPMGIEVVAEIRHPLGTTDFSTFLPRIQALKPDVLCMANFGRDQEIAVKQATDFGLKKTTKLVLPVLLYSARVAAGSNAYDGVIGGSSYYWKLEDTVPSAKAFNDAFRKMFDGRVPSDYGALGYGGVKTILESVKAAGSVDTDKVIAAMEALKYDYYKGPQYFRGCDHQSVQSVLILESRNTTSADDLNVFNIIAIDPPDEKSLMTCSELGHV